MPDPDLLLSNDDNPIQGSDRLQSHSVNINRASLDPRLRERPYNEHSGWSWATVRNWLFNNPEPSSPENAPAMSWHGQWTARQYYPGNVVRDGLWTMVANKTTSDKAAPVLAGSPAWSTDAAVPSWTTQSPVTSLVVTGVELNSGDIADMVLGMRVYIPKIGANIAYRVVMRVLVSEGVYRDIVNEEIFPSGTGWHEIATQGFVFDTADTYQYALMASDSSTTTDFNGRWNFVVGTANYTPAAGEAYHKTNDSLLRIHNIDGNTDPQGTNLDTVVPGTQIEFGNGAIFTVDTLQAAEPLVHNFIGSFTGYPASDWQNITFKVPADAATDYVEELGYWTTNSPGDNASVQGIISLGGAAFTKNDTLYGVDLLTDEVQASPAWDVVALSDDLSP